MMGKSNRSFSTHCFRMITARQSSTPNSTIRNAPQLTRGTIHACHGIDAS